MSQKPAYPGDLPTESHAIYDAVLSRFGSDWSRLRRQEGESVAECADAHHRARDLVEFGALECRHIAKRRENGTVCGGHLEFRKAAH